MTSFSLTFWCFVVAATLLLKRFYFFFFFFFFFLVNVYVFQHIPKNLRNCRHTGTTVIPGLRSCVLRFNAPVNNFLAASNLNILRNFFSFKLTSKD